MTAIKRTKVEPWLGAYRSPIAEVQQPARVAAHLVVRYSSVGQRVPDGLYRNYRRQLATLIDKWHHEGDVAIRAARFAIDALDANHNAPACQCGWVMAPSDKHDHEEFDAVCGECCAACQ